jgi:predicted alternative tryptophan synthase beta-subunit
LRHSKLLEAYAYSQEEAFRAGRTFIECERIVPAPETCHALKAAIDLALEAKKNREKKVIVVCFSGSGLLDMKGYKAVLG